MRAAQTVFLTEDRKTAVPAGDKRARFKLVHEGQEIAQLQAEKYEGAIELIGGTKKKPAPTPEPIESRDPEPQHRDPESQHRDQKHRRH